MAAGALALIVCLLAHAAHAAHAGQDQGATLRPAPRGATVLLRIDLQVANEHVPPSNFVGGPRVYLANIDSRQEPHQVRPLEPLRGDAGAAGWVRLALEPGTYFLLVVPPGLEQNPPATAYHAPSARFGRLTGTTTASRLGGSWDGNLMAYVFTAAAPRDFLPLSGFLLRVPDRTPALYVGTFRIICTSGRGLFGNLIDVCSDVSVSNEAEEAIAASRALKEAPEQLEISLVSRYGSPMAPLDIRGNGVELVAVGSLAGPATMEFAVAGSESVPFVAGSGPGIAVYNILVFVGREASRAAAQSLARQRADKWRPCIDRMASAARDLDLIKMVGAGRTVALAPLRGPQASARYEGGGQDAATPPPNYALMIAASPHSLALRECPRENEFCLELAMRVMLRDSAAGRDVFDGVLAHSAIRSLGNSAEAWYLLPTQTRGRCRPIEDWCGDRGVELLQTDTAAAVGAIVDDAVSRAASR